MWVSQKEYQQVGAVLAQAREQAKLSQQQLAKRLRKPQSFISNYERGQRRVDLLEFLLIIAALDGDPVDTFRRFVAKRDGIKRR